jgi:hypothetical protein
MSFSRRFELEPLEQRIMLSADPLVGALHQPADLGDGDRLGLQYIIIEEDRTAATDARSHGFELVIADDLLAGLTEELPRLNATIGAASSFTGQSFAASFANPATGSGAPLAEQAPRLPGLVLMDSDLGALGGQLVYLDTDGAQDLTYDGPIQIDGIDIAPFRAPGELAGQEDAILQETLARLAET